MTVPDDDVWAQIGSGVAQTCVNWLRKRLADSGLFDITVPQLVAAVNCNDDEAEALLQRAEAAGLLMQRIVPICPCCGDEVDQDETLENPGVCPNCGQAFTDCGQGPKVRVHYFRADEVGRSVPWVLVLHGMNTRGAWQEKLSWLIATTYGRSVPVFIYKYGRITTGVLLGFRRRKVMRDLAQRITELSGEREHSTLGGRPDVIAHSFGTWLIGHALASTEDDLKGLSVGRVVLLGSILRPNFAWAGACHRGRAEAVLNHYGARDRWAGIGGYVIYDAGPSGRRGFDPLDADGSPQVAIGRQELEFGHRTFFDPVYMEKAYVECWKPFLTAPMSQLPELERGAPHAAWRPPPRVLRFGVATLVLLLTVACGMVLGISVVVGLRQLLS